MHIGQSDFDALLRKLEGMRQLMRTDPGAALPRIDALLREAREVRERSAHTPFEPAIVSVCGLLASLRRGVEVRVKLNECYAGYAKAA